MPAVDATEVGAPPAPEPGSGRRRRLHPAARGALSFLLVAAILVGLLRDAGLSAVGDALADMTGVELAGLLLVGAWNLTTYWFVMICVLPGLGLWRSALSVTTSTAISNTLPGGAAFGVATNSAMYASWGFGAPAIALALVVSGVWNTFVKLGMPVVALAFLALAGGASAGLVTAALAGVGVLVGAVVLFALVLRREHLAVVVGGRLAAVASWLLARVGRGPVGDWAAAAVRFRQETVGLLRTRWAALTVATVLSHVSLYLVLLVALRDVGVSQDEVGWAEVLGAFSFVRLLTALPITPGGVGVVELGLTAALVVAGGDRPAVVAAVLVFRGLTYLLPVPLGVVTYVIWRRSRHRADPSPVPAPDPGPPPAPD